MALTISQRPQKTLSNGFLSAWTSSELPILYKIQSDLYPVNNVDSSNSIFSVALDSTKQLTKIVFNTIDLYNVNETIKIVGTQTDLDGGIFKIVQTEVGTGNVWIDFYTTDTSTGVGIAIKHYDNYNVYVNVFAGAKEGHPYNTDGSKPMVLVANSVYDVDVNNNANIDIKALIKEDLKIKFDNDNENNIFEWTDFYIEHGESYDIPTPSGVGREPIVFVKDNLDGCIGFTDFLNPSFDSGGTDWLQGSTGAPSLTTFSFSGGNAIINGNDQSKILFQEKDYIAGVQYSFDIDFVNNLSSLVYFIIYYRKQDNTWESYSFSEHNTGVYNMTFTLPQDSSAVGMSFSSNNNPMDFTIGSLNVSSSVADVCTFYGSALTGTKQFQDELGGNFGDYVLNDETSKILTLFDELTFYDKAPFYISAIIPQSTFDRSEGGNNLKLIIDLYDAQGNIISTDNRLIENKSSGVYVLERDITQILINSNDDLDNFSYGKLRFAIIPTNIFKDSDNGTFEVGAANTWGITNHTIAIPVEQQLNAYYVKSGLVAGLFDFSMNPVTIGDRLLYTFTSPIPSTIGSNYIVSIPINISVSSVGIDNTTYIYAKILGTNTISNKIITKATQNIYYPLDLTFTATTPTFQIEIWADTFTDVPISGQVVFNLDDITVKGPIQYVSEEKKVVNSKECSRYTHVLRWINILGGWESWDFARKSKHTTNVSSKINIKKDITSNFDDYFINGETETDTIKSTVSNSIVINSQLLTANQLEIIQQLRFSPKVQYLIDGKWQTVTTKRGSFVVIDQGEDINEISFTIELPNTITQQQ